MTDHIEEPVVVRDDGFQGDDWQAFGAEALDLPADVDVDGLDLAGARAIRVTVRAFTDGRAFTLARRLRARGFAGRLRIAGPLIADQYAMARRCGFDEVEIPADLARRQPEAHWSARADWRARDYQARLLGVGGSRD